MDLHTASALGIEAVVKCAIFNNPELALHPNSKKWTPLMYACMYCQEKIVALLVNRIPCCIYQTDAFSQTPLMLAAKTGNMNIVEMVMQPDILDSKDNSGWTALFYAVYYGHVDVIHYLIRNGADINARDYQSQTVLMIAVQNEQEDVVGLLLVLGANPGLKTKENALKAIDMARNSKNLQLIILLSVSSVTNLWTLFNNLRLEEYFSVFKDNNLELDEFLKLNESDLKLLSISKIGPRKVMALAIEKCNYLNNLRQQLEYNVLLKDTSYLNMKTLQ